MTVLSFVILVSLALALAIFALARSRRRGVSRAGGGDFTTWFSDGGGSHSDSGADCGASDGGGCDGGGD
jgi:uncharacterized membrane protein